MAGFFWGSIAAAAGVVGGGAMRRATLGTGLRVEVLHSRLAGRLAVSLAFCPYSWSLGCWSTWQNLEKSGWISWVGDGLRLLRWGEWKGLIIMVLHFGLLGAQHEVCGYCAVVSLAFYWVLDLVLLKPLIHHLPCNPEFMSSWGGSL